MCTTNTTDASSNVQADSDRPWLSVLEMTQVPSWAATMPTSNSPPDSVGFICPPFALLMGMGLAALYADTREPRYTERLRQIANAERAEKRASKEGSRVSSEAAGIDAEAVEPTLAIQAAAPAAITNAASINAVVPDNEIRRPGANPSAFAMP